MQMKRVVVFLPSAAVKACDSLADRYGSNRSEVVRLAIAEGSRPPWRRWNGSGTCDW